MCRCGTWRAGKGPELPSDWRCLALTQGQSELDLAPSADCPQRPRIASSASVLQRRPTAKDSAPSDSCGPKKALRAQSLLPFENERPRDAADASMIT